MARKRRRVGARGKAHAKVTRTAQRDGTYERLLEAQGGVCAICRRTPEEAHPSGRRLHIDHDHVTMEIRGLLCFTCNRRLTTRITARWLLRAALYLLGLLPGGRNESSSPAERKRLLTETTEGDSLG